MNIFADVDVPKVTLPIEFTDKRLCPTFEDTVNNEPGVEEPIPTLPFCKIENSEVPVDDATLNGLVPARPCTLNEYEDEVALIPATIPLSNSDDVPSVVADTIL